MPLVAGTTVGRYRIVEAVGDGASATVYRAWHPGLQAEVALKVIHPDLAAAPAFQAEFRGEAALLYRLNHPHILRVLDCDEADGAAFIVYPFIAGGTLADLLLPNPGQHGAWRPLPVVQVLQLLGPVAAALDHAHDQRVLHRDVKPGNILLSAPDATGMHSPVVAHFGIARILQHTQVMSTRVVGTPAYMAPEQWRDQALGPSTDQYALAVTAYQLLTGSLPFSGPVPALGFQHVHEPVPPPSRHNPALPPPLEPVVLRALAKEPTDRFPSCTVFVEALVGASGRLTAPAPPPAPQPRLQPPAELPAPLVAAIDGHQVVDAAKAALRQNQQARWQVVGTAHAIGSPYNVAVGEDGAVYVAGVADHHGYVWKLSEAGDMLGRWGGPDRIQVAADIAVDANGDMYVADKNAIVKLSATGDVVARWGERGRGVGQLRGPDDLVLDGAGKLLVIEEGNGRIQIFAPTGKPLVCWGTVGTAPGQFYRPSGIALDKDGNVYVADWGNRRVQKLSPTGRPVADWEGSALPALEGPYGVAVDSQGYVYISDREANTIWKLSPRGEAVASWGGLGTDVGQFDAPFGIAVDRQDNLYVADFANHRIQKYSADARP